MNDPSAEPASHSSKLAVDLRILLGTLIRRLREQSGPDDLTASQKSVLLRLERDGPATASALARAEGMRPQSMGAIIMALQAIGFVTGTPDPGDGRQTIVSLTDLFRDWAKATRAAREDWLDSRLQTRLTPAERDQLAAVVDLLKRLIDPD